MRTWSILFVVVHFFLVGCASLSPIKAPEVSLVSITPDSIRGFSQYFTLNLLVTNPNSFDLDIDGVTFNLDVVDKKVFSGVSNAVPLLKAYAETPVTLSAGVGLFDLLKLITLFGETNPQALNYNLTTTIDPNGFIPLTIKRNGAFSQEMLSGLKQGKNKQ